MAFLVCLLFRESIGVAITKSFVIFVRKFFVSSYIRHGLESSRTGEATSVKRMQSGSSSPSGRNRGAAAAEVQAIGELQSKWTQSRSSSRSARNRGAVEIGEEQPKWTQV